ncbi:MAG: ABC transporter permease subunit, partial [Verrucomicrobiota bacterium]
AFQPALDYQADWVPDSAPPFYQKVGLSLWLTIKYAACAISLSIIVGVVFGSLATQSWWNTTNHKQPSIFLKSFRRIIRILITAGRSIHELLWALLLVTALGTSPLAIIIALTIPYGSTLAKVFSEILDEQSSSSKDYLLTQGGHAFDSWLFTTVPSALPDLISYALYRFECAIRSAAILGFVGIPTLGYHIQTAMGDFHLNEIWTLLYTLLATILIVEFLSNRLRGLITKEQVSVTQPENSSLEEVIKHRPRNLPLKISIGLIVIFIGFSWLQGESPFSDVPWEKRMTNLERFLSKELTPYPVQQSGNWADALPWAHELLMEKGFKAAAQTFYIATAAMVLAFVVSLATLPFASKRLNQSRPLGLNIGTGTIRSLAKSSSALLHRIIYIIARAMPEYLLAFLLVQIFGPTAWPLILGLALHNYGIVGRLGGELIDNSNLREAKVQLAHGSSTLNTYLFSILPAYFNRFLLYFFYRWETCIRDATVFGIRVITSLGFLISDASARDHNDEMLFFILLGAAIVMIGDFASDLVRSKLRG